MTVSKMPKKNIVFATISFMLCQTIYMFYVTSRAVVLPTILSDLGGMPYYSITLILSSMTMAVTTPLSGKLGDIFGRKRIYIIGLGGYLVSILLCATATNTVLFMVGIALSGTTYGIIYPQMVALLVDVYEQDVCPKILGYASVAASASSMLGPVVGGLCADFAGWRLVFLIMVPFAGANLVCAAIGMPNKKPLSSSGKVDYKGTMLFAACVMPFLYMLTAAGSQFSWISFPTLALLTVTIISFILLLQQEKIADNPIVPLKLFKKPVYLLCLSVTIISGLCFSGMNYLPIYYQVIKGMTSTMSGLATMPRQIGTMIAALIIGQYFSRHKNFKIGTLVPICLFCASLTLMGRFNAVTAVVVIFIAEAIFGIANGAIMVTPNAMGQHYLKQEEMGTGLAFISFASTFGNSFGAAVTGCIISQFWNVKKVLPTVLSSALSGEQIKSLSSTNTLKDLGALSVIRDTLPPTLFEAFDSSIVALKQAFNHGLSVAFISCLVLAIILAITLSRFSWKNHEPD